MADRKTGKKQGNQAAVSAESTQQPSVDGSTASESGDKLRGGDDRSAPTYHLSEMNNATRCTQTECCAKAKCNMYVDAIEDLLDKIRACSNQCVEICQNNAYGMPSAETEAEAQKNERCDNCIKKMANALIEIKKQYDEKRNEEIEKKEVELLGRGRTKSEETGRKIGTPWFLHALTLKKKDAEPDVLILVILRIFLSVFVILTICFFTTLTVLFIWTGIQLIRLHIVIENCTVSKCLGMLMIVMGVVTLYFVFLLITTLRSLDKMKDVMQVSTILSTVVTLGALFIAVLSVVLTAFGLLQQPATPITP